MLQFISIYYRFFQNFNITYFFSPPNLIFHSAYLPKYINLISKYFLHIIQVIHDFINMLITKWEIFAFIYESNTIFNKKRLTSIPKHTVQHLSVTLIQQI